MQEELAIDIETYSAQDINSGVYRYVKDPFFEIMLLAWSSPTYHNGEIQICDFTDGESLPKVFYDRYNNPLVLKTAYNAQFERTCLNQIGLIRPIHEWSCTMALAARAGLPFGLENVAKVIGGQQKDKRGKDLISYFSIPCKPTKSNDGRIRNLPHHDAEKWIDFREYCKQDVATELGIRSYLKNEPGSAFEFPVYALDQKINDRGVLIDFKFVRNAIKMSERNAAIVEQELRDLTGLANPNSVAQIKKHVQELSGIVIPSLNKDSMKEIMESFKGTDVEQVLGLREKLSHAAVKKYVAMLNSVNQDGRIRGLFQYCGANRTWRWTSRNVQLQNLKRNDLDDLDGIRETVREDNWELINLLYDDIGSVLSNLVRTAFIPGEGKEFIVSDLSAIEARVLSWLAEEGWRMKVFETHGKIYEASASMMFNVPLDKVDSELRRKGKIAELALGYQGSVGAMEKMGGSKMGLSEADMVTIVTKWRKANRKICRYWYDVQEAAVLALTTGQIMKLGLLRFYKRGKNFHIKLPSGRELSYINCRWTGSKIIYEGMNQTTKQWGIQDTYGGKLVENIVQAVSRDILADAMVRMDTMGMDIVMHVHDEIVIEGDPQIKELVNDVMETPIPWAPGLPLRAETFTCKFYQK